VKAAESSGEEYSEDDESDEDDKGMAAKVTALEN